MPYRNKQMLRDANGDLIPQYWDVAAGDFKPLTGSNGASNTQVTGSNVELVKLYKYTTAGTNNAYFGNDVRTGPMAGGDLNISQYKKISVTIKNDTDKQFNVIGIYFRVNDEVRDLERITSFSIELPSGAETNLNAFEHEDIEDMYFLENNFYPYMRLRVLNSTGLGSGIIHVAVLGVK